MITDTTVVTPVLEIDAAGTDLGHGESRHNWEPPDRYQCVSCGFELKDRLGRRITGSRELFDWLQEHEMLEESV